MDAATTSTSLYGDRGEERGAGGKLKRPSGRKPPATPYSRPAANPRNSRFDGGWWSKLVDPAKRLVSGGATMLLPSFFSQSASVLPTAQSQNELDVEISLNADKDESHLISHFVPKLPDIASPSKTVSDKLEANYSSKGHRERPNNAKNDSEISRIEQLIEGKNFSRDEVNRLMEILTSKIEGEERKKETTKSGRAEGVVWSPSSMVPDERNQRDADKDILRTPVAVPLLQSNVHNAVGASPVDIAKAYMGSRTLECELSPHSAVSKGETSAQQTDAVVLNPLIASTSIESSTCWPGAVVQDPCNYTTPRPRSRYGLHDFPRTPYSRTIHSKSRDKPQLTTDSCLLRTSLNPYPPLRAPIFGQEKLRNHVPDDLYGSVGPIRRIGNKFASETRPRGSNFPKQISVPDGIILPPEEAPKKSSENIFSEPALNLNRYPSQTVKRILDQLDTKKPTPKEMADELKLAASWRNSPGLISNQIPTCRNNFSFPQAKEHQPPKKTDTERKLNGENVRSQIQSHGKSIASSSDMVTSVKPPGLVIRDSESGYADIPPGYYFGQNNKSSSQIGSFQEVQATSTDTKLAETGSNLPSFTQSNGQYVTSTSVSNQSKIEVANNPPQHPSGSKPNLAYISVSRHDLFSRAASSENGAGFTFPISTSSTAMTDPPTPSVMPFSSNNSLPSEPSFSFGTKSAARLVFSFPSTSSSLVNDASDLKFEFGTDKKARLSFGSVGKDATCY